MRVRVVFLSIFFHWQVLCHMGAFFASRWGFIFLICRGGLSWGEKKGLFASKNRKRGIFRTWYSPC